MTRDVLAELEARVLEAATRIEELQRENDRLRQELLQLPLPGLIESPPPPPPPPPAAAAAPAKAEKSEKAEKAWTKEREELRRRLELLIARLESLLA